MDKKLILSAVLIQSVVRVYLARKRVNRLKIQRNRFAWLNRYDIEYGRFHRKFEQIHAVKVIENWIFNRWKLKNKLKWNRKDKKMIQYRKKLSVVMGAIKKIFPFNSTSIELDKLKRDQMVEIIAVVLQRVIRGFMARNRLKVLQAQKNAELLLKSKSVILIQATGRMLLKRCHHNTIAIRYRINLAKLRYHLSSTQYKSNREPYKYLYPRRNSILFPNLKLGDLNTLEDMEKCSMIISRRWKKYYLIILRRRKYRIYLLEMSARIYRWYRRWRYRQRLLWAVSYIRPKWIEKIQKKLKLIHIVENILIKYLKRRVFYSALSICRYRRKAGDKLRSWMKLHLYLIHQRQKLMKKRLKLDQLSAGKQLFHRTELFRYAYFIWQGAKKTKNYELPHELQKIFSFYSLNGGLDNSKWLKCTKDCQGLVSNSSTVTLTGSADSRDDENSGSIITKSNLITPTITELLFAKIKGSTEKRIDYSKFVELIGYLALIKFLRVDPGKVNSVQLLTASPSTRSDAISNEEIFFQYAGLTGRGALISRFIITYIATIPEFRKIVEHLGTKSAYSLSQSQIQIMAKRIQSFFINRRDIATLKMEMLEHRRKKIERHIRKQVVLIQTMIRGYIHRRRTMRVAQKIYNKYVDGETERDYWFNPRTDRSFWTKPPLLGPFDCGIATRMPTSLEQVVVVCQSCRAVTATCYCLQCQDPAFCTSCYAAFHKAGQRKSHQHLIIDNCVQCEFQLGTVHCRSCKDIFCDSCYKYMHKKGRLRYHVGVHLMDTCDECKDRSAQRQEMLHYHGMGGHDYDEEGPERTKLWCNVCYYQHYDTFAEVVAQYQGVISKSMSHSFSATSDGVVNSAIDLSEFPRLSKIYFYGKTVKSHFDHERELQRQADITDSYIRRQIQLDAMKRLKAASFIQRVFRGYLNRNKIERYLQERRQFFQLRNAESLKRKAFLYKFLTLVGFAPPLASDTPLERVRKIYPGYMKHVVEECIEYKWNFACQLLLEHEEHMKKLKKKASSYRLFMLKMQLYWVQRSHRLSGVALQSAELNFGALTRQYQNGLASGVYTPAQLSKMKRDLNRMEQIQDEVTKQHQKNTKTLRVVTDRLTRLQGPRGFQKLVDERRKNGLLLPFKITLRRGSQLALVEWPVPTGSDPKQEEMEYKEDDELMTPMEKTYEFQPNKWKECVQVYDTLLIQGGEPFRIIPPLFMKRSTHLKDHSKEGGSRSGSRARHRKKRPMTGGGSNKDESQGDKSEDKSDSKSKSQGVSTSKPADASGYGKDFVMSDVVVKLQEDCTDDHIQLERPWLLDDVYRTDVYKKMPSAFYMKPVHLVNGLLVTSYPVQKMIAITTINYHKTSKLCLRMKELFDEESEIGNWLHKTSKNCEMYRDQWLLRSRKEVQMSYDFTARRKFYKAFLQRPFRISMLLSRVLYNSVKSISSRVNETPFEFWSRSLTKEELIIVLELEGQPDQRLGEVLMDLNAPCDIMREAIERKFRDALNQTIGDSFLFFRINEEKGGEFEILERDNEPITYSKDYAIFKTNKKTMEGALTVTMVKDPSKGRVIIPEFVKASNDDDDDNDIDNESSKRKSTD